MVNYKCLRCGYETTIKTILIRHLNRKRQCKPVLDDVSKNHIIDFYFNIHNKMLVPTGSKPDETGSKPDETGSNSDETGSNSDENSDSSEIYSKNNKLQCLHCKKFFLKKEYLEKHLKKSCKMLVEFNNIYKFDKNTFGRNIFKNKPDAGDIYIIQTDYVNNDHYKIGISKNIKKRLCQYRCSNTYEPRLHYYFPCQNIKEIDHDLNNGLKKFNVKREIFKGDIEEIKNEIINIIKKKFQIENVDICEPDIKIGDLCECSHCNKCFYTTKDLFAHFNICEEYKESLNRANKDKLKCKYCEKQFSFSQSLYRHYKICKEKKKDDEEKKNLLELVNKLNEQLVLKDKQLNEELRKKNDQIDEQNKQINELIKKAGITQNIQQNIKILAYKNTDISHLTDQDYMYCLNRSNMCIPNLIKKIHFDPQRPENHNVYISNIKNKYIMIYDGNKWNLHNQDETIEDLIDTNEFVLEQKLEEWVENGKDYPDIMRKFTRYLEKKEKDDVLNKIKEEIKLILFNNRKTIEL